MICQSRDRSCVTSNFCMSAENFFALFLCLSFFLTLPLFLSSYTHPSICFFSISLFLSISQCLYLSLSISQCLYLSPSLYICLPCVFIYPSFCVPLSYSLCLSLCLCVSFLSLSHTQTLICNAMQPNQLANKRELILSYTKLTTKISYSWNDLFACTLCKRVSQKEKYVVSSINVFLYKILVYK